MQPRQKFSLEKEPLFAARADVADALDEFSTAVSLRTRASDFFFAAVVLAGRAPCYGELGHS